MKVASRNGAGAGRARFKPELRFELARIFARVRINPAARDFELSDGGSGDSRNGSAALPLTQRLQMALYERWYPRRNGGSNAAVASTRHNSPDPELIRQLSGANQTANGAEPGWHLESAAGLTWIARKGDRLCPVPASDWVPAFPGPGSGPMPGRGAVRVHREAILAAPPAYVAFGQTLADQFETATFLRFYFHASPPGAVFLLRLLSQRLNAFAVPFRFKCPVVPRFFDRADSAVLYVARHQFRVVAEIINALPDKLLSSLHAATPMFTKHWLPGIGLAEDPGGTESFGLHRCRLLAEALVNSAEQGAQSVEDRLAAAETRFLRDGLKPQAPYLNPGSLDIYSFSVPGRRTSRLVRAETHGLLNQTALLSMPDGGQESTTLDLAGNQFLSAAIQIGHRLCRDAIWSGNRCTWTGWFHENDRGQVRPFYGACSRGLALGIGGIAVFLARLSRITGEPILKSVVLGANPSDQPEIGSRHETRAGLTRRIQRMEIALAQLELAHILGWAETAEKAACQLRDTKPPSIRYHPRSSLKLALAGLAVLLTARRRTGDLLSEPIATWAGVVNQGIREHLQSLARRGRSRIGLDPGARFGTALCLHEAGELLQRRDYCETALELLGTGRTPAPPAPAGPAIAVIRGLLRSWIEPGYPLPSAVLGKETGPGQVPAPDSLWASPGGWSIGFGAGAVVDLLLETSQRLAQPDLRQRAQAIGSAGVRQFAMGNEPWPCAGAGENPTLLAGLAGIGYVFLRLADSDNHPALPWVAIAGITTE